MKKFLLIGLLLSFNAFAYDDSAEAPVRMADNQTNYVALNIIAADNVQAACERESIKRGFGGYKYRVQACSFWDHQPNGRSTCVIVVRKVTSIHNLGHELQHCLQGNWHNE